MYDMWGNEIVEFVPDIQKLNDKLNEVGIELLDDNGNPLLSFYGIFEEIGKVWHSCGND